MTRMTVPRRARLAIQRWLEDLRKADKADKDHLIALLSEFGGLGLILHGTAGRGTGADQQDNRPASPPSDSHGETWRRRRSSASTLTHPMQLGARHDSFLSARRARSARGWACRAHLEGAP